MTRHTPEPTAQKIASATSEPSFRHELGPDGTRKAPDDIQAAPIAKPNVEDTRITVPAEAGDFPGRIAKLVGPALENIMLPTTLAGAKPDQPWVNVVINTMGLRDRLSHGLAELSSGLGALREFAVEATSASRLRIGGINEHVHPERTHLSRDATRI